METTLEKFKKLSGIDLTDHEVSGVFPYYKNGKWSSISRGKAWQIYSKWLEGETTSQQQTIESLREDLKNVNKSVDNLLKDNRILKSTIKEIREQTEGVLEITSLKNKK